MDRLRNRRWTPWIVVGVVVLAYLLFAVTRAAFVVIPDVWRAQKFLRSTPPSVMQVELACQHLNRVDGVDPRTFHHLTEAATLLGAASRGDQKWSALSKDVDAVRAGTAHPDFSDRLDEVRNRCDSGIADSEFKPVLNGD